MTIGWLEEALYRRLGLNPCVAIHELRTRMRGGRAFLVFFVHTFLAATAVVATLLVLASQSSMHSPVLAQAGLGRTSFSVLAYAQLSLILIVLPGYAAGAITMEREKRTLEMLRATLLSASDVVTGKLGGVAAFGAIVLVTSLPVAAWCLLLGGVGPWDIFYVYAYLLVVAVWVAALGLFFSARQQQTVGAIVATYVTLFIWCVVAPVFCCLGGVVHPYMGLFYILYADLIIGDLSTTVIGSAYAQAGAWAITVGLFALVALAFRARSIKWFLRQA